MPTCNTVMLLNTTNNVLFSDVLTINKDDVCSNECDILSVAQQLLLAVCMTVIFGVCVSNNDNNCTMP